MERLEMIKALKARYPLMTFEFITDVELQQKYEDAFNMKPDKRQILTTILYHENDKVLEVDYSGRKVTVVDATKLPFSLRSSKIDLASFEAWLNKRVSILSRTYMSKIYSYRGIGRSQAKLIIDSSAVSIIDNFWIQRPDTKRTWDEILTLKDTEDDLFCVALEGKENPAVRLKKFEDITSILTIKGAFPKVAWRNKLLKYSFNAEFEIVGTEIGNALGIPVAQARESNIYPGAVECDLFTDANLSMAHAADLLSDDQTADPRKNFYDMLTRMGRTDMAKQFQRILILSYLCSNFDMHQENFGVLYSPKNFDIISMAPAYDFNDSFQNWGNPEVFHAWEMNQMGDWVRNNIDLVEKIETTINVVLASKYLNDDQKQGIVSRLRFINLLSLGY